MHSALSRLEDERDEMRRRFEEERRLHHATRQQLATLNHEHYHHHHDTHTETGYTSELTQLLFPSGSEDIVL